ncbi:MAG: hypothetical protein K5905_30110 [Roseibium sp.]|uniref:imm11 family protein n=1 Tax=Roseibium sp. TaxID=1936156 RepID=UPI00260EFDD5|nr:DUF1629 domain-containing protein [Roseibium sp.]MCV0429714.1 hypothetical protein [Roseibium sp.]
MSGGLVVHFSRNVFAAAIWCSRNSESFSKVNGDNILMENNKVPVYTIFEKTDDNVSYVVKPLNGDFKKVYPSGFEFDLNSNDSAAIGNVIRQSDRTYIEKKFSYQGVPVHLKHLPTSVQIDGPRRPLTDLLISNSIFLVSNRFRAVVEELEPQIHQFASVELVWKDDLYAGNYFWFYPCARVDGMNRVETTHELRRDRYWKEVFNGNYVVDLLRVGNNNIWIDPRVLAFYHPFVSETFKKAMDTAAVSGVGYHEVSTTD